jgi:hypothetical protein
MLAPFANVPHRPIATETLFEHTTKNRDFRVYIVEVGYLLRATYFDFTPDMQCQ